MPPARAAAFGRFSAGRRSERDPGSRAVAGGGGTVEEPVSGAGAGAGAGGRRRRLGPARGAGGEQQRCGQRERAKGGAHSSSSVSTSSQLGSRELMSRRKVQRSRVWTASDSDPATTSPVGVAGDGGDIRLEPHGDQRDAALDLGARRSTPGRSRPAGCRAPARPWCAARPRRQRFRTHGRRQRASSPRHRPSRRLRGSGGRRPCCLPGSGRRRKLGSAASKARTPGPAVGR